MRTIEIFNADKEELNKAIKAVEAIGEDTDETTLISSLMHYLPQIIKEDYGICLDDYEQTR